MARTKAHPNQIFPDVVQRVDSAEAMRSASFNSNANDVFIGGLDGGLFQRDPDDTSSAEDGGDYAGLVIRPPDYATAGVFKRVVEPQGPYNVMWWGAQGDDDNDDYDGIQRAFTAMEAKAILQYNGVKLWFPAGCYRMSAQAVLDLGSNQSTGEHGVHIYGDGQAQTLIVPEPGNTDGCFLLTSDQNSELWEVDNMSFQSELSADAATNNGYALHVRSTLTAGAPGYGTHKRHSVKLHDLFVGGKGPMGSGVGSRAFCGNFDIGIFVENKWFIRVDRVKIAGSQRPYDSGTNAPLYTLTGREAAIRCYNCYSPLLSQIYIDGYYLFGVNLQGRADDTPLLDDVEDFRLMDSFIVGCNAGFYMEHPNASQPQALYEPGGAISNCHFFSDSNSIILRYHRQVIISACYIYLSRGQGAPNFTGRRAGIWALGTSDITIEACQFLEPGFFVDDDNTSVGVHCQDISYVNINDCHFNCGGVGVITHPAATGKVLLQNPTYSGQTTGVWAPFQRYIDEAGILAITYTNWDVVGNVSEHVVESTAAGAGTPVRSTLRSARSDFASNTNPQCGEFRVTGKNSAGDDELVVSMRGDWDSNTNGSEDSTLAIFARYNSGTVLVAELRGDAGNNTETSLMIRVNRSGSYSLDRVSIGAVDSGGAGFRLLRVEN